MVFTLNIIIGFDPTILKLLSDFTTRMGSKVDHILANEEKIMASLDDVLADVTAETTAIDSVSTMIQGLRDQIANAGLSAADQAKVDAIFATAEANKQKISAALAANVPVA